MIAPDADARKSLERGKWANRFGGEEAALGSGRVQICCQSDDSSRRNHSFVNRIIMRPQFGQAHAKLACEGSTVASGPGSDRIPDSSAPQPPGVRSDRAKVFV
jgi:hypothetical protein